MAKLNPINDIKYAIEILLAGTSLWRVFTQLPTSPDGTLSYNQSSSGRASPVKQSGLVMPAMYVSMDSVQGAIREFMYHAVEKTQPKGAYLSKVFFQNVMVAKLALTADISSVSVHQLMLNNYPDANMFNIQTLDYTRSNRLAQEVCDLALFFMNLGFSLAL
jgi:hypothetical protein